MLMSKCVVSTSLLESTGAVSCYPAPMVNLIWFADEKVFIVSTNQHEGLKSGEPEAQPSRKILCAGALFCWKLQSATKVKLSPQMRESNCFG